MAGRASTRSGRTAPQATAPRRNDLGRERVTEIQRARILAATVEVSAEHGAGSFTVAHVVVRAGISRRTFYEIFADREGCFLAAFEDGLARASRYALAEYDPRAKWTVRVRAALTGLLSFLEDEPASGQLLIVGSLGMGAAALERRRHMLARISALVEEGGVEARAGQAPPPLTAEGVVGAVFAVIHARLVEGRAASLLELVNPLMSMVVLPYLGPAASRRELDRPVSRVPGGPSEGTLRPLKELEVRLTYRTVRVLTAVAANPGASNRTVAEGAGIDDQGQTSKLLWRLQRLGLLSNRSLGAGSGAPNSWTLTSSGEEVNSVLAAESAGS
ncbi:MAG TPA: TetR/AcrR family transcriptional regulator [Solirubrobacteraceae bacterium]|jgi:AcrR family transcriptional regulator|nr:TetR/AcrR family transcriptional regulator [Solirubrobacteraceae bacterium]